MPLCIKGEMWEKVMKQYCRPLQRTYVPAGDFFRRTNQKSFQTYIMSSTLTMFTLLRRGSKWHSESECGAGAKIGASLEEVLRVGTAGVGGISNTTRGGGGCSLARIL